MTKQDETPTTRSSVQTHWQTHCTRDMAADTILSRELRMPFPDHTTKASTQKCGKQLDAHCAGPGPMSTSLMMPSGHDGIAFTSTSRGCRGDRVPYEPHK